MKYKVLVIEDNDDINDMLKELLQGEYDVSQAFSGTEAFRIWNEAKEGDIDIILLDLMLPGMTGEELIREIRKTSSVPIIVLTAKGDTGSLVRVLELGADDYVPKPFKTAEVLARMKANLRRLNKSAGDSSKEDEDIVIGDISINQYTKTVLAKNKKVDLTQKEFELLYCLMIEPDRVFTKEVLYTIVWQQEPGYMEENTINVHISRLRNKIKSASGIDPVRTIWGIGLKYYFDLRNN